MRTPYRNIILLTVLHECETWSLTLWEEHRVRVFKNRVLRKIYWAKRDEITGEWRRLKNKELYDLYFMGDQSKENKMGWTYGRNWRKVRCIQDTGGENREK